MDGSAALAYMQEVVGRWTGSINVGVSDGSSAMSYSPSVVFMDITMPGMSGVDVMRAVPREFSSRCRVIAMTGNVDSDAVAQYLQCGFYKVLAKPFHLADVHGMLEDVLDNPLGV